MVARKTRTKIPKPIVKCGFMTNKDNANLHSVAFNNLTSGEVLALIHAPQLARQVSRVAQDLSSYLSNALTAFQSATGDQRAQEFWTELAGEIDAVVTHKGTT